MLSSIGFVALSLIAAAFVLLPLMFNKRTAQQDADYAVQSKINEVLYQENLQQLDDQRKRGEIAEKTYQHLKDELEKQRELDQGRRQANNWSLSFSGVRWILGVTAVALPLLAIGLYQYLGAQPDWQIKLLNDQKVRLQERDGSEADIRALNKQLEELLEKRVAQRADNLHNQFLLARIYAELENYGDSLDAYQKILNQRPQSPEVLSEMAQVLYLSKGNQFTPEVKHLFDQAIQMDPQNARTISYAGLTAYQGGNYTSALEYWRMALDVSEPNSRQYQTMMQAMRETETRLREAGIEPPERAVAVVPDGPKFQVQVALGDKLAIDPNYKVYVYARAWKGPKMPLAIHETKVADLPQTITLDESMGMPGIPMKLSQFPELELVARVSQTGVANAQPGDWEVTLGPIAKDDNQQTYQLVITSQIP